MNIPVSELGEDEEGEDLVSEASSVWMKDIPPRTITVMPRGNNLWPGTKIPSASEEGFFAAARLFAAELTLTQPVSTFMPMPEKIVAGDGVNVVIWPASSGTVERGGSDSVIVTLLLSLIPKYPPVANLPRDARKGVCVEIPVVERTADVSNVVLPINTEGVSDTTADSSTFALVLEINLCLEANGVGSTDVSACTGTVSESGLDDLVTVLGCPSAPSRGVTSL